MVRSVKLIIIFVSLVFWGSMVEPLLGVERGIVKPNSGRIDPGPGRLQVKKILLPTAQDIKAIKEAQELDYQTLKIRKGVWFFLQADMVFLHYGIMSQANALLAFYADRGGEEDSEFTEDEQKEIRDAFRKLEEMRGEFMIEYEETVRPIDEPNPADPLRRELY